MREIVANDAKNGLGRLLGVARIAPVRMSGKGRAVAAMMSMQYLFNTRPWGHA